MTEQEKKDLVEKCKHNAFLRSVKKRVEQEDGTANSHPDRFKETIIKGGE
jgi:hypothetical protein